jgi:Spy/CpxP family protein refolding chaperone
MKKTFEKDKPLIGQMKTLHEKLHQIVAADSFDSKAFLNVTGQIEKIHDRLARDRMAAFASVAGQFTPEERKAIAIHFAHRHHHHDHDGHDGKWHHPMDGDRMMNGNAQPSAPSQDGNTYPPYRNF